MFEVIHIYYIFIYYIYYIYIHYYLLYFYYIYIYIITYIYIGGVSLILSSLISSSFLQIQTNMWEESCYQWNYHDFSTQGYLKVNISSTFIWNVFFISYNNAMIEIRHCYWKIVHEHENLWKVTLKGEKLESQYSPF